MADTPSGYNIPTKDLSGALSPNYGSSFNLGLGSSARSASTAPSSTDTSSGTLASALAPLAASAMAGYQGVKGMQDVGQTTGALGKTSDVLGKAGQTYLGQALGSQLTQPQQATVDTLRQQAATLGQQAQPYLAAGAQGLQQYEQGQLPEWQQQQLDNQTAAAIAQARASMGANVDSSAMAQIEAQIRQQASIAKGQILQSNLKISQELAQFGFTEQNESMALYTAANDFTNKTIQQDFSNAIEALGITDTAALQRLQASITGNQAVGGAVGSLLGNITKATTIGAAQGSGGSLQNALYKLGLAGQSGDMSNYLNRFASETGGPGDTSTMGISYLDVPAPTFDTPALDVGNIDLSASMPDIQF
jgi:hypothetical protein